MSGYERFYEESLYPLQNGILRTLAPVCGSVLSLTGGTALSRIYFRSIHESIQSGISFPTNLLHCTALSQKTSQISILSLVHTNSTGLSHCRRPNQKKPALMP